MGNGVVYSICLCLASWKNFCLHSKSLKVGDLRFSWTVLIAFLFQKFLLCKSFMSLWVLKSSLPSPLEATSFAVQVLWQAAMNKLWSEVGQSVRS